MNIFKMIEEKKTAFRQAQNKRDAQELRRLKRKREVEEGRARLIKLKEQERNRIKKARETRKNELKRRFGAVIPKQKPKEKEKRRVFGEGINPAFSLGKK